MILGILILLLGVIGHAGAISGGGGKGVVCRDVSNNILSATTLDLYEGKAVYNLKINESNDPVDVQVQRALAVIPATSRGLISAFATSMVPKGMQIVHGMTLQPVDDALVIAVPRGCQVEQLANYFDNSRILIDGDIWDKLSPTAQASLILHESVYATERALGATNSQRTRHVVASLFDLSTKWTDVKDGVPANALTCVAKGAFFYAYQQADKVWVLQFQILGSNQVMSKKSEPQYGNSGFDFNEAKNFPVLKGEDKIGISDVSTGNILSDFENDDFVTISKRWDAVKDTSGNVIKGYQMPRYYLHWTSGTYPATTTDESLINCGVVLNPSIQQ